MRTLTGLLLVLATIAVMAATVADAAVPAAQRTAVRVVRVTDGDTIHVRLRDGRDRTVRVIGIDTPETVKPATPVECGGREASQAMRALVLRGGGTRAVGRAAVLVSDPTQASIDRYGRTLAYVEVDGRDVGRSLVRAGWASVYVYDAPFRRLSAYRAAAAAAKAAHAGAWGRCGGDFHRPR